MRLIKMHYLSFYRHHPPCCAPCRSCITQASDSVILYWRFWSGRNLPLISPALMLRWNTLASDLLLSHWGDTGGQNHEHHGIFFATKSSWRLPSYPTGVSQPSVNLTKTFLPVEHLLHYYLFHPRICTILKLQFYSLLLNFFRQVWWVALKIHFTNFSCPSLEMWPCSCAFISLTTSHRKTCSPSDSMKSETKASGNKGEEGGRVQSRSWLILGTNRCS